MQKKKEDYNDNSGFTMETGHFTQLVWKSSTSIGLGISASGNTYYCTAQYSPPGNMQGQFKTNFLINSSSLLGRHTNKFCLAIIME